MSSDPSHHPRINRDYVRLLMVMRRFIKEEFNQTIRISDEEAGPKMLEYGEKSRNRVLREMASELREFIAPFPPAAHPEPATPCYRGVPLQPDSTTTTRPPVNKGVRIYRGRPITDGQP